jgi:hypothetical protein
MPSKGEIDAAAKAMLLRQTCNLNSVTWDQLPPKSQLGYLEDARIALEVAEQIRAVECREDRRYKLRNGIAMIGPYGRSVTDLALTWMRSFRAHRKGVVPHGGNARAAALASATTTRRSLPVGWSVGGYDARRPAGGG